jgi:uncharacterized protein with NRDE domain
MCTVSYVFSNGQSIITSNRDEQILRPAAVPPQKYEFKAQQLFFPKDPQAGGTWYAATQAGVIVVLLNGAEEKHVRKQTYRKSRGLIVLDLISEDAPLVAWQNIDLSAIEPFTLVVFQNETLYQLRWNEIEKSTCKLDAKQSYIWSSATLYSKDVRDQRCEWFRHFIETNSILDPKKMMQFHTQTNPENTENGLVINRNNALQTLSVTQTILNHEGIEMSYFDLQTQKLSVQRIK